MKQPSRKAREQQFRVDLVLEAAEEIFAARGFQGAAMEDIASRAQLSVGSIYNVFPSKEALFATVIERRHEEFLSNLEAAVTNEASALQKLERIAEFTFGYFEDHQHVFQLYLSATNGFLWNVRRALGEATFQRQLRLVNFVAGICREGMTTERWPRTDPMTLAWAVIAILNAFITQRMTTDPREPLAGRLREMGLMIRRLVGAGARVPSPGRARARNPR